MMSEIVAHHLRDAKEIKIYDPTSGSGSLLLNIGRSVGKYIEDKNKIVYYAQELKEATYNLTRMNLVMRGILPDNIVVRNGDTLEEDWPWFDDQDPHNSYEPLYCDAVVSNPPYSQEWTPKEESKTDPRYKNYGVAPKSTADYAFLLHDLYHVKPGGIMTIVLPHGVLFRGGEEGNIRKNLVENNNIDAIIGLPANIFFGAGIPTIVMVLKQKRDRDDILIVDASKGFEKVGKNNQLRARDIRKIVDAVTERREIPKFSKLITRQDVRDNDYNLNIPRYVNSADSDEQWDINAIMFGGIPNSEIDTFKDVWNTFPTLREQIFASVSDKYSRLRQADVDEVVMQNDDFNSFISSYNAALVDMPYQLRKELFEEYQTVNVGKKIREITTNLFSRVKSFEPIIDSYAAYQLLEDQWNLISNDLEILQTEGIEAARVCDPKMEIKKKDGKDVEVQVGWQGRVMPFEIVQEYLLPKMLEEYQAKKDELENTRERIQEILSEAQELDPQPNYLKDDGSAFVSKEVKAECKRIKARIKAKENDPESLAEQILEVDSLLEKEKVQKNDIAAFYDKLIDATMDKIAHLSDDEIVEVLHRKHLVPLFNAIAELPMQQESQLVAAIYALNSKYGETLVDIDKTIYESEKSLATLVDNLTGSDADMAGLREFQKLLRHE
jgi:type I restriction enzyme M protein